MQPGQIGRPVQLLTIDEHRLVVERLTGLAKIKSVNVIPKDFGYKSLMVCLLMHSRASAESLITLHTRFGNEWFPITTGYVIVRSLFEVDVTAQRCATFENPSRTYCPVTVRFSESAKTTFCGDVGSVERGGELEFITKLQVGSAATRRWRWRRIGERRWKF